MPSRATAGGAGGHSCGCRRNRLACGWAHAARGSDRRAAAGGVAVGTIPVSPSNGPRTSKAHAVLCAGLRV
jgi:hypothetical protein